jgi:phosphatidylinositol glycan class S
VPRLPVLELPRQKQVYFPDEHKVAVYLPLLGPIGVPLVASLLKELKRIAAGRKARRAAAAA